MDIIKHNMAELVLALNHNYREEKTTNTAFKANNDYLMLDCKDFKELQQRAFSIIEERERAYTKRTGQKVQAKTAKAVEIIIEVNEDTTAQEILESYGEYFKNNFGVEILGIAIHRDEGYLIGKEPPHRRLTSGIEFELDQDTGKYYELVSDGKNYKRGTELDITAFKEIKNNHAQIIFSNLRADGSSVTSKHDNFKVFDKSFFKDFSNNWQKIYNKKFPNKKPLLSSSRKAETDNSEKSSVFEPMLQLMAEKIIQGTRNKEKLTETLEKYIEDNKNPIQRIKGYKHFLGRLNKVAYGESLNKRDYGAFLSQMKASGCAGRLSQIIIDKISQMSDQELKECDTSTFGRLRGMVLNMIKPVEVENPNFDPKDAEIKALKTENTELKAELDTAKTELKEQINEGLEDNSQKHTALKPLFLSSDELDIYAKNKEIVAQAKDALTSFKTAEMISALKALRKQNRELEDILKKRALRDYADLKARSGSKIAEGSKTTQTLTQTEKRAENSPNSKPRKQR